MIKLPLSIITQALSLLTLMPSTGLLQPALADSDCSSVIEDIQIEGNKKTQARYLLKWSELQSGQTVSQRDLDRSQQKILNTGLYIDAIVEHNGLCQPNTRLTLRVREKHYHLVYPRLSRNGDGDIDKGIRYRGHNLFGIDQSLSLLLSRKDYASGNSANRIKIDYELNFYELPYQLRWYYYTTDTELVHTADVLTAAPVIEKDEELALLLGRNWQTDVFNQPITVLFKLEMHNKSLSGSDPEINTMPGDFHSFGIQLEYDKVKDLVYRRTGHYHTMEIKRGLEAIGSDSEATQFQLEARYYHPINELDNLNARLIMSLASGKIFNQYNYTVGGAGTLRGIESGLYYGNGLWQANLEYVIGYRRWPSFRTALFSDIGNVFKDAKNLNSDDWKQTFGIGLRWKLTSYVNTDLIIDFAYDPDSHYSKVYAATSLLF